MMNSRCLAWSFSEGYMMALFRVAGKTSESFSFHYSSFFGVLHDLHRFIVRDFTFSEDEITKQQREFEVAGTTEKELWVRTTPLTNNQLTKLYLTLLRNRLNSFDWPAQTFPNPSKSSSTSKSSVSSSKVYSDTVYLPNTSVS